MGGIPAGSSRATAVPPGEGTAAEFRSANSSEITVKRALRTGKSWYLRNATLAFRFPCRRRLARSKSNFAATAACGVIRRIGSPYAADTGKFSVGQ
jgi:hypothetical protein